MKYWFNESKRGRRSLKDKFGEGCPNTVILLRNIEAVRELIVQERHVTYREIAASLGISAASIYSILHEQLAVEKICCHFGGVSIGVEKQTQIMIVN